jgi:hypothetical protein
VRVKKKETSLKPQGRGVGKFFGAEGTSDSDISHAKALRTPSSEKFFIFLCALGVFAGKIPGFGLRLRRARSS